MAIDFHKTKLWKDTLGKNDKENEKCIEKLRTSFESSREKISSLLKEVRSLFPDYTIHDISHADALWNMSDNILKESKLTLNPAEGYVLGCSFLFHYLGMSPAIYENQTAIENADFWKDSFSFFGKTFKMLIL